MLFLLLLLLFSLFSYIILSRIISDEAKDRRIAELERELVDFKNVTITFIQNAALQASITEESRAVDRKEINRLLNEISNAKSLISVLESELESTQERCIHSEQKTFYEDNLKVKMEMLTQMAEDYKLLQNEIILLEGWKEEIQRLTEVLVEKEKEIEKQKTEIAKLMEAAAKENANYGKQDSKKYIVVHNGVKCFAKDKVETINYRKTNNLRNLQLPTSWYDKKLFVVAETSNSVWNSSINNDFAYILAIFKHWKALRPDGEIHVIGCKAWNYVLTFRESISVQKIIFLTTTFASVVFKKNFEKQVVIEIGRQWPGYANELLTEEAKQQLQQQLTE